MGPGFAPIVVAVIATAFFAVYGFLLLVFPHRIRDRHAAPQALRTVVTLRVFGVLLLLLSATVIWAAMEATHR